MPNRSMQIKTQRAGIERAAYAGDCQMRADQLAAMTGHNVLTRDMIAGLMAEHEAKRAAIAEQRKAQREALGKRTKFAWSRS